MNPFFWHLFNQSYFTKLFLTKVICIVLYLMLYLSILGSMFFVKAIILNESRHQIVMMGEEHFQMECSV